jgi:hypothetical protein
MPIASTFPLLQREINFLPLERFLQCQLHSPSPLILPLGMYIQENTMALWSTAETQTAPVIMCLSPPTETAFSNRHFRSSDGHKWGFLPLEKTKQNTQPNLSTSCSTFLSFFSVFKRCHCHLLALTPLYPTLFNLASRSLSQWNSSCQCSQSQAVLRLMYPIINDA